MTAGPLGKTRSRVLYFDGDGQRSDTIVDGPDGRRVVAGRGRETSGRTSAPGNTKRRNAK